MDPQQQGVYFMMIYLLVPNKARANCMMPYNYSMYIWLVVSTHLKNISQNGNLPQLGVKKKMLETTT